MLITFIYLEKISSDVAGNRKMVKPRGVKNQDPKGLIKEFLKGRPKTTTQLEDDFRRLAERLVYRDPNYKDKSDEEKKKQISRYSYSDRQIRDYCRTLQAEGEIEQQGQKGPYSLPDNYFDDLSFFAERIGHRVPDIFKKKRYMVRTAGDTDRYYRNNSGSDVDEEIFLFDFIIKSGAVITDAMLEAMAPKPDIEKDEDKTDLARMYIQRAINLERMLLRFRQLPFVKEGESPYPGLTDSEPPRLADELWSGYELDEKTYKMLRKAFASILPNISSILVTLRTEEVPKEIVGIKKSYKDFLRRHRGKQIQ
jgi:hypothetical protein